MFFIHFLKISAPPLLTSSRPEPGTGSPELNWSGSQAAGTRSQTGAEAFSWTGAEAEPLLPPSSLGRDKSIRNWLSLSLSLSISESEVNFFFSPDLLPSCLPPSSFYEFTPHNTYQDPHLFLSLSLSLSVCVSICQYLSSGISKVVYSQPRFSAFLSFF